MTTRTLTPIYMALLAACAAYADVIIFNDETPLEGYVTVRFDKVCWTDRDYVNSAEWSTSKVLKIKYGEWLTRETETPVATPSGTNTTTKPARAASGKPTGTSTNVSFITPYLGQLQKILPNVKPEEFMSKGIFAAKNISKIAWVVGLLVFCIVSFVMQIIVIVDAFKNSVLWGLLCLCCGPAFIIYLFSQYTGNKLKAVFWLVFPLIWMALGKLLVQ